MTEPTNDELRRRIAELLGWLFVKQVEDPIDGHLFLEGRPPGDIHVTHVLPNWPEDLNAAAGLLAQAGFMLWHNGAEWEVQDIAHGKPGDGWSFGFSLPIIASHPNPARAICLAFVAMHEVKANE